MTRCSTCGHDHAAFGKCKGPTAAQMAVLRQFTTGEVRHHFVVNRWEHVAAPGTARPGRTRLLAPVMARILAAGWLTRRPTSDRAPGEAEGTTRVYLLSEAGSWLLEQAVAVTRLPADDWPKYPRGIDMGPEVM